MTQLHHYLARLQTTLQSRHEIDIEVLEIFDRSDKVGQSSEIYAVIRFYNNSRLQIVEKLSIETYAKSSLPIRRISAKSYKKLTLFYTLNKSNFFG